jgi:hypothetical protein
MSLRVKTQNKKPTSGGFVAFDYPPGVSSF